MKFNLLRPFSLLLLAVALWSCQGQAQKPGFINQTIEPAAFEQKLSEPNIQLVDVRSEQEFADGGLPNAQNINYNGPDFESRIAKLDKNKPVLVYCLSGGRSGNAANKLQQMGFREVYNMQGGMVRWRSEGRKAPAPKASGMSMAEYQKAVQGEGYVLVDFNAAWCAPCKKMLPWITQLAETRSSDLRLLKVDADQNAALLTEMGIKGIPYLELYQNGKRIYTQNGYISEEDFRKATGL